MLQMIVHKKSEFFLSIAQQSVHSFIMLGVVKDGEPQLLARVGKTNDIDADKSLVKTNLSRIADEHLFRKEGNVDNINYQAYSINYEQVKEFLGMISEIEKKQLANPAIVKALKQKYGNDGVEKNAIQCFVPVQEHGDHVTFEHKKLKECELLTADELKSRKNSTIVSSVQSLHLNNTCRTSSKNIVEAILGFVTDVSDYFFITPKYESKLIAGQPKKESFYILPPPPNCANVSPAQESILKNIYKRLEEIPKLYPEAPVTRKKFDALKSMYKDIAGENKLSAKALLGKILEHEDKNQNSLFEKRFPNFLSRLFSIPSSTKRMLDDMENTLKRIMTPQEVNEVKKQLNKKESASATEDNQDENRMDSLNHTTPLII